ncbi:MAG: glycosyltransferase family 2 protein [Actinobacteria bacterium]|nr:glycosyltransferase family 2 protein [Actinomycetota bacterium]
MGRRKEELERAVSSLLSQEEVTFEVVVVGNGWDPQHSFPNLKTLHLHVNLGIPAGRNAGAREIKGENLFFLDDDVTLHDPKTLLTMKTLLRNREEIGLIQPRVISNIEGEATPKRWVPRLRVGDPLQSSVATSLWEGATVIRRRVFEEVGGWPDEFFYGHEGIDLIWRTLDREHLPWYAADITVQHPVINPARHSYFYFLNARNRVWLAKRHLRFPFSFLYPLTWLLITITRIRRLKSLGSWLRGFISGIMSNAKGRGKMRWKTHWLLARYGRPPLI